MNLCLVALTWNSSVLDQIVMPVKVYMKLEIVKGTKNFGPWNLR